MTRILGIVLGHGGALLFFLAYEAFKLAHEAYAFYVIASGIACIGGLLIFQGIKVFRNA
jgi:hypothetical protein